MTDGKAPVDAIPLTTEMKRNITEIVESVISCFDTCEVDEEKAGRMAEALRSTIYLAEEPMMDAKNTFDKVVFKVVVEKEIGDVIGGLAILLNEIRKNEVLFDGRQVLVAAMRDALAKDNRSFAMIGAGGHVEGAEDIGRYTDDARFVKEYCKLVKRLEKGGK